MYESRELHLNYNHFSYPYFFTGVMFRVLFFQYKCNLWNFQFNVHKNISNTNKKNLLVKAEWLIH